MSISVYFDVTLPVKAGVTADTILAWAEENGDEDIVGMICDHGGFKIGARRLGETSIVLATFSLVEDVSYGMASEIEAFIKQLAIAFGDWNHGVLAVLEGNEGLADGPSEWFFGPKKAVLTAAIKFRETQLATMEAEVVKMHRDRETANDELCVWYK